MRSSPLATQRPATQSPATQPVAAQLPAAPAPDTPGSSHHPLHPGTDPRPAAEPAGSLLPHLPLRLPGARIHPLDRPSDHSAAPSPLDPVLLGPGPRPRPTPCPHRLSRLSPIRQPHAHQPNTGLGPSGIAKATPWAPPPCPPPLRQQGSGRAANAVLAATRAGGARRASQTVPSMAIPSGPCCQIRALVIHVYPDGIKAYSHERHTVALGRRGKPVKRCASSRPSGPMPSHASCRGGLAPRCRCSEALGLCRPVFPAGFLLGACFPMGRAPRMERPWACCRDGARAALVLASDQLIGPPVPSWKYGKPESISTN